MAEGGAGSGPHPGTGKNFGDSTQGIITVSHNEGRNTHETAAVTKQIVKSANGDLKKSGFVKGATEHKNTPSGKMGHSEAYSGGIKGSLTSYSHPDGRTATMRVSMPKYGTHTVTVVHRKS